MNKYTENIIEITSLITTYMRQIDVFNMTNLEWMDVKQKICQMARQFEVENKDTSWDMEDYYVTIENWTKKEFYKYIEDNRCMI